MVEQSRQQNNLDEASDEFMLLPSSSSMYRSRIPTREWCHPEWTGLPASIRAIKIISHSGAQWSVSQVDLGSVTPVLHFLLFFIKTSNDSEMEFD